MTKRKFVSSTISWFVVRCINGKKTLQIGVVKEIIVETNNHVKIIRLGKHGKKIIIKT